jgi:photosystem II stability/assembly factor-like uncharacterized protein
MLKIVRAAVVFMLLSLIFLGQVQYTGTAQAPGPVTVYVPLVLRPDPPVWLGPDGGSVVCLTTDPKNPNVVYAGTISGGIYKSTNQGGSWSSMNQGLGNRFIDSIAVDPANSNILYAGTHGTGVYKSINAGESWFPVNSGIAAHSVVYSVAVNPGNTSLVYAATRIEGTYYHGILYKSVNGGASWSSVMSFQDDWVYSIAVHPTSPNVVLAAVHTRGPMISTDYGGEKTWQRTTSPALLPDALQDRWTKGRAVAFDPRGWTNRAVYTAWHDGLVSYSNDQGRTWALSAGGTAHIYPNGISFQPGTSTVYLAAHSSGEAPGGVYRADDAGEALREAGLGEKFVYSVAALAGPGGRVLAGTYAEGAYYSADGGANWVLGVDGLRNSKVTGMVFARGAMYASTETGGGVWKSTDGGVTWKAFDRGLFPRGPASIADSKVRGLVQQPGNPNILYALTNAYGLRRVDLSGTGTWKLQQTVALAEAAPAADLGGRFSYVDAQFAPDNPDAAYFGQPAAMRQPAASQPNDLQGISAPVVAMAFAPGDASVAYMATNGGGVWRSSNGGITWAAAGLARESVRDITVDKDHANTAYAVTTRQGVLYQTRDSGKTWKEISLPDGSLHLYAVKGWDAFAESVFVGTNDGIYQYNGSAWRPAGLQGLPVLTFAVNPVRPEKIFAGTAAGGFYSNSGKNDWVLACADLDGMRVPSISFDADQPQYAYFGTETRGTLRVTIRP